MKKAVLVVLGAASLLVVLSTDAAAQGRDAWTVRNSPLQQHPSAYVNPPRDQPHGGPVDWSVVDDAIARIGNVQTNGGAGNGGYGGGAQRGAVPQAKDEHSQYQWFQRRDTP